MLKRMIIGIVLLTSILAVACSSAAATDPSVSTPSEMPSTPKPDVAQTPAQEKPAPAPKPVSPPKPEGPIKAIWIDPTIKGDMAYIPINQVEENWNVNFKYGDMNFMAYVYDGDVYVRANVCPPCRSIGFSLLDDILVCDRCATTFEAKTGDGIKGACVDFPKASVKYKVEGDNLVMTETDLIAAY